ncbi:MAG: GntR family transcriptional regulator [Oscillospiraceae bacterium]|nr:GntR family transcriptional regulator [Oscillospiraceae bacterium]
MARNPKYMQVANDLKEKLAGYSYEQKLPTEAELVRMYDVSRQTIRVCLDILREENLIRSIQGSGSYYIGSHSRRDRTMRIGVITTYISDYIFPSILRGIEETLTSNSYSLMLNATNNSVSTESQILRALNESAIDGLIVEGTKTALPNPNSSFYHRLAEMNIPVVFINGYYSNLRHENIIHVVTDDHRGGCIVTERLADNGHRSIGSMFKSDDIQGINRYSGYIDTLARRDIAINDSNVMWFTTESRETIISASNPGLIKMINSCSAVVCYNDETAVRLAGILNSVPNTVKSVVSFDNCLRPDLRGADFFSIDHPKGDLGSTAVRKLLSMINGNKEQSVALDWRISGSSAR